MYKKSSMHIQVDFKWQMFLFLQLKSFNDFNWGRRFISALESPYFKSFMSSLHSHPVWVTLYQSSHAAVVLHIYIHSTYSTNVLLITVVIYHYCRSHLMTYLLIENSKMLTAWKHLTIFKWILRILTQLEIFKKSKEQNVLKRHSVVFFWFRITSSGKGLLPPPLL